MVSNADFDGKATHLNCFYLHINFEQKYPKPAIVLCMYEKTNLFVYQHFHYSRKLIPCCRIMDAVTKTQFRKLARIGPSGKKVGTILKVHNCFFSFSKNEYLL